MSGDPFSVTYPSPFERKIYRASQIALLTITAAWFFLALFGTRASTSYDQLGMSELHWSTELVLAVRAYAGTVLPCMALALLLVGVLANKRATRQALNLITVLSLMIVVLWALWMIR